MSWFTLWGAASVLNAGAAVYSSWVGFAARSGALPQRLTPRRLRGGQPADYRRYSWQAFGAAGMCGVFSGLFAYLAAENPLEAATDLAGTTNSFSLALAVAAASVVWLGYCNFMASKTR